jgi:hypothetical protein
MTSDRIALQNVEFDAMRHLAKAFDRCINTPVVDDDYPEMRYYYESALRRFAQALIANRGKEFYDHL